MVENIICSSTDGIEVLGLSDRVHNALRRSYIKTIGELLELNQDELFAVRNMGEIGVSQILERLENVTLVDAPLPAQLGQPDYPWTAEVPIDCLGPPMIPRHEIVHWQQIIVEAQIHAKQFHPKLRIDGLSLEEFVVSPIQTDGKYEQLVKTLTAPLSVSQELECLLGALPERELDIIERRCGFDGQTLQSVAFAVGVSRERVRQIQQRAVGRMLSAAVTQPLLRIRSAVLYADDMNLSFEEWAKSLVTTGLLGDWAQEGFADSDQLELLIIVCRILEKSEVAFEIPYSLKNMIRLHGEDMSATPARMLVLLDRFTKEMEGLVKWCLRNSGVVSLDWLVDHDDTETSKVDLRLVLELKGYIGMDENWYMSLEYMPETLKKDTVFHRSLLKMFQFCGPLEIHDVDFGLEHSLIKTDFPRPPVSVLTEVLISYGYECEDGLWYWDGETNEELNRGEGIIMQTIGDNDGVVHHFQLGIAFINSPLSLTSLHATLRRSPLFDNFEHSLYKLRGAIPNPTSIQKAHESAIETPLNLDYYFDMDGNIVVLANLGTLALGHGTIMSAKLPNLVGCWDMVEIDGESVDVEVTENGIRGLRRTLQLLGCAVGDRIKMTFDTDTHEISVSRIEETLCP